MRPRTARSSPRAAGSRTACGDVRVGWIVGIGAGAGGGQCQFQIGGHDARGVIKGCLPATRVYVGGDVAAVQSGAGRRLVVARAHDSAPVGVHRAVGTGGRAHGGSLHGLGGSYRTLGSAGGPWACAAKRNIESSAPSGGWLARFVVVAVTCAHPGAGSSRVAAILYPESRAPPHLGGAGMGAGCWKAGYSSLYPRARMHRLNSVPSITAA